MIQPTAKQRLQYFAGKPVTVFTRPINMPLTPEGVVKYCVGIVESIDDAGIMLISQGGSKTYFYHESVCFIAEEKVEIVDESPEQSVSAPVKQAPPQIVQQAGEFVDIDALERLAALSS